MQEFPIRLAFRVEDNMWNCYIMQTGVESTDLLFGSIKFPVVRGNPIIKQKFMDLMQEAFNDIIGLDLVWPTTEKKDAEC